jgi:RimJ/RimL family protein N-acetyltransferase
MSVEGVLRCFRRCAARGIDAVTGELRLRRARLSDAGPLLAWRNDPLTRRMSHKGDEVKLEPHLAWLASILRDEDRRLFIAEIDGVPAGTVRADFADGAWELSWTVAPEQRSRGIGRRMVAMAADLISGPIRAEVKVGNTASIRIAEAAGMQFSRESAGVIHLERPAQRRKS